MSGDRRYKNAENIVIAFDGVCWAYDYGVVDMPGGEEMKLFEMDEYDVRKILKIIELAKTKTDDQVV